MNHATFACVRDTPSSRCKVLARLASGGFNPMHKAGAELVDPTADRSLDRQASERIRPLDALSPTLFDGLNDLEAFEFRMPDKE